MPRIKLDEISKLISQGPTDALAFGRTALANERTLLAFLRTTMGLLGGGIGIIGFVDHPLIEAFGWLAIVLSAPFLVWGIWRYRNINKLLTEVAHKVLLTDKNQRQSR
jgi:putative membrane protein